MDRSRIFSIACLLLLVLATLLNSCRKEDNTPVEYPPGHSFYSAPPNYIHLDSAAWECYASCDSVAMDTIARNDTLQFSIATGHYEMVSWNHTTLVSYQVFWRPETGGPDNTTFYFDNSPFGKVFGQTTKTDVLAGQLSGVPFRNRNTHTTTYLWLRRIQ